MVIVAVHHQHVRTLEISHAAPAAFERGTHMVKSHC